MPLLPSSVALAASATACSAAATTTAAVYNNPGNVVCAFPVSGQYGPGSRILYYVLVAGCVLGRGNALLRGACLAAALLVPAVAAIHAIVLAAVHVDKAVDMDIYGALQICAIGVLAGPVTVKLSATYFNTPGRNLIFVWTTMIFAGLLSLIVEFFRVNPTPCTAGDFQYNPNGGNMCDLVCNTTDGPTSPIRGGAQNNIYVIPSPTKFSFSAAILVSAACCIPAVLSLISMWNKILEINWKKRFGRNSDSEVDDQPISGTNAATPRRMTAVNTNIRFYLSMVEIPIFGSAIVVILIVGELNLFSAPVLFQQEPMASVGQWAPIAGTLLAVVGSLYAFIAAGGLYEDGDSKSEQNQQNCSHHCRCHDNPSDTASSFVEMQQVSSPGEMDAFPAEDSMLSPKYTHRSIKTVSSPTNPTSPYSPHDLRHISTHNSVAARSLHLEKSFSSRTSGKESDSNTNSRHKVARLFETLGNKIGTPAPGAFDDAQFRKGAASNFPLVPGEKERNENLREQVERWDPERDIEGNVTPIKRQRSRTGSFISERSVNLKDDGLSEPNTPVVEEAAGPSSSTAEKPAIRRATLQVPKPSISSPKQPRRSTISTSSTVPTIFAAPAIQVSEHEDAEEVPTSEAQTPTIETTHEP